ncbi:hypothetical protein [Deinococcus sp. QL22]|uniref:hypothetical protein n=1 Tax=Deinococcus sp. QL22 TaxID=2939437 RepID=UPI002016B688|nr:hypothetical protein [Deinococcus sp. QL22]UQN04862.1 hypothetical protein M1R55_07970 [Deinococcus sp. QL22]
MPYAHPVTLANHVTVTVTGWGLGDVASHAADVQAVIDALTAPLRGTPSPLLLGAVVPVLARVLQLSLTRPEDAQHLAICDLAPLLQAIWDVNGLADLAKKSLARQLRAQTRFRQGSPPSP